MDAPQVGQVVEFMYQGQKDSSPKRRRLLVEKVYVAKTGVNAGHPHIVGVEYLIADGGNRQFAWNHVVDAIIVK